MEDFGNGGMVATWIDTWAEVHAGCTEYYPYNGE